MHTLASGQTTLSGILAVLQELLEFVAHYHCLLDLINLVTCLYRLAKMSKEASRGRSGYLAELQRHPTFQLLLRECLCWSMASGCRAVMLWLGRHMQWFPCDHKLGRLLPVFVLRSTC
jgi:hypothetical protein